MKDNLTSLKDIYDVCINQVDGNMTYMYKKEEMIQWNINGITIYIESNQIRIKKDKKTILEYQVNKNYNEIYQILLECNGDFKKKESFIDKLKNKLKKMR